MVHAGTGVDTVGPGEYEVNVKKVTRGPTKWVVSDVPERVFDKKKEKIGLEPGPGHYKPPISSINPIYKNNKSSAFASRVPRTSSSAVTKNRVKVMAKKDVPPKYQAIAKAAASAISPRGVQDIIESDDDDNGPGPG